jgi:hypothetical protein
MWKIESLQHKEETNTRRIENGSSCFLWGLILPPCWFASPTLSPLISSPPFNFHHLRLRLSDSPPINGLSTGQFRTSCPGLLYSLQRRGALPIVSKALGSGRVDDIGWRLVARAATTAMDGRPRTRATAGSRICIAGVPTCRSSASHHYLCTALIGRLWFATGRS